MRRKIGKVELGSRLAKIYRDNTWDEYRVVFYLSGTKQLNSDYHCSDKNEAFTTAAAWVKGAGTAPSGKRDERGDGASKR